MTKGLVAAQKSMSAERFGDQLLRSSLGLVYLWFGALKLLGMSPVLELIRAATPSLSSLPIYLGLAVFEVGVGVALLFGVWTRRIAAVVVLHLIGTFSILVTSPQLGPTLLGLYGGWGISGGPMFPVYSDLNGDRGPDKVRLVVNFTRWF